MKDETKTMLKYAFGGAMVVLGILIEHFHLAAEGFQIFGSVGIWLIYIGFMSFILTAVRQVIKPKQKKADERNDYVAAKAMRVTFLFFILVAFAVILVDGIAPIAIQLHMFMSYLVCLMLMAMYASYYLLLKYQY